MKKIMAALTAVAVTLSTTGCFTAKTNAMAEYDYTVMNTDFIQLQPPKEGDTIAIIDTEYGEIRAVLYEDICPNTVAAFIERAENGEYNDQLVQFVIPDAYFMTGGHEDKRGVYIGRESDDELIENEYSVDLWPFCGALMAYSEKKNKSDARWFISSDYRESITIEAIDELKASADQREDEAERANLNALFDKFYEVGGVFGLSGTVTVFGQTYEGMDVVDKLCNIPVDENTQKVREDVKINSVTISTYTAEE